MIYLYSQLYVSFHKKCLNLVSAILQSHVKSPLIRSRFKMGNTLWPISIAFFEHQTKIGQFNSNSLRLEFNKNLIGVEDELLSQIIQHELAHYLTFIEYGQCPEPHGLEFHAICKKYHFEKSVPAATLPVTEIEKSLERNQKIFDKVAKLLQLSSSSNTHESQLALIKANQLLHQHQLDLIHRSAYGDEIPTYVLYLQGGKRFTPVEIAISEILKNFYVYPILNYGREFVSIEVIGNLENVELAAYIAAYLKEHLEKIWLQEKKKNPAIAKQGGKRTFMRVLSMEYNHKISNQKKQTNHGSTDLVVLESMLETHLRKVHPRLTSRKTFYSVENSLALEKGILAGQNLNIRSALKQNSNQTEIKLLR